MNRSVRIPLFALGAALMLAALGACGDSLGNFGDVCSPYAVENDCAAPESCWCRVGLPSCVCTHRCLETKDCPAGTECLPGQVAGTTNQDLLCFKADGGTR